eukprot:2569058-Pleurochrysis_carterae.AAC.1
MRGLREVYSGKGFAALFVIEEVEGVFSVGAWGAQWVCVCVCWGPLRTGGEGRTECYGSGECLAWMCG